MHGWPLVGLMLALAFFGHDLLMAAPAQTSPEPAVRPTRPHAGAMTASTGEVETNAPATPEAPHHQQGCGVGQRAVHNVVDKSEILPALRGPSDENDPSLAPVQPLSFLWGGPEWSAATLRAILQVYRL